LRDVAGAAVQGVAVAHHRIADAQEDPHREDLRDVADELGAIVMVHTVRAGEDLHRTVGVVDIHQRHVEGQARGAYGPGRIAAFVVRHVRVPGHRVALRKGDLRLGDAVPPAAEHRGRQVLDDRIAAVTVVVERPLEAVDVGRDVEADPVGAPLRRSVPGAQTGQLPLQQRLELLAHREHQIDRQELAQDDEAVQPQLIQPQCFLARIDWHRRSPRRMSDHKP
jgi:hypothetical protein